MDAPDGSNLEFSRLLEGARLRQLTLSWGSFLLAYSVYEDSLIALPRSFLTFGDDDPRNEARSGRERAIITGDPVRHRGHLRNLAFEWFVDLGAFDADHRLVHDGVVEVRNALVHQPFDVLLKSGYPEAELDQATVGVMSLHRQLSEWWLNEVERAIDPEAFPQDADIHDLAVELIAHIVVTLGERAQRSDTNQPDS